MKKELARLEKLIKSFEEIAKEYPNGTYGKSLARLQQQRVDLVNQIGRRKRGKKCR
jgi:transposase